jgi:hypothetical protein
MRILQSEPPQAQDPTRCPDFIGDLTERNIDQDQRDLLLHRGRYTGASFDLVSNDWIVWVGGDIVGWVPTEREAQRRAFACQAAQVAS